MLMKLIYNLKFKFNMNQIRAEFINPWAVTHIWATMATSRVSKEKSFFPPTTSSSSAPLRCLTVLTQRTTIEKWKHILNEKLKAKMKKTQQKLNKMTPKLNKARLYQMWFSYSTKH